MSAIPQQFRQPDVFLVLLDAILVQLSCLQHVINQMVKPLDIIQHELLETVPFLFADPMPTERLKI